MIVYLTPAEADGADNRAGMMRTHDLAAGGRHRYRMTDDEGDQFRSGVRCETAASKWSGEPLQPPQLASRHEPDVGYFDVRGTRFRYGGLIVHKVDEGDPAERPFVLVLELDRFVYDVAGWAYGHEAQQPRYWRVAGMRYPCFLVPQRELRPIELLPIARPA